MKKILLVDDEQLITLSVAKMIHRSGDPYEVVGTKSNGKEALDFLKENPVDIAIVDIRMPMLDGIGLLQEIQKLELPVQVIILSAYRDFEYAQSALHYGASAYLLKPLSQESLMHTLCEVSCVVDQRKTLQTASNLFSKKQRQQAVYCFLEKGETHFEHLPASFQSESKGTLLLLNSSLEFPQPFIEECNALGWEPYRDFQLICFLPDDLATENHINKLVAQTRSLMNDYFLPTLSIAGSNNEFSPNSLQEALLQCKTAAMYAFYFPQKTIIYYSNVHLYSLTSIRPIVAAFEKLHEYIRLSNKSLIFKQLEKIYQHLKVEMGVNPQTLYQLFYELFMEFQIYEKSHKKTECSKCFSGVTLHSLQQFVTLDSLYEYSISLITCFFEGKQTDETDNSLQIIENIKEFCLQNYATDCTLDDMASKVYITKNYLSQIFKEKCGISIWNYLTDIRIEKAKHLLSSTEIKVNHIGEMVGYKNASHFGHIFRGHVGISPKEFRQKIRSVNSFE